MRSTAELAWFAGLFEGEGSIGIATPINKNGTSGLRIALSITSTDRDVLLQVLQHIQIGRLYGPYDKGHLGTKPQWRWMSTRLDESYGLLCVLYPFLLERRRKRAREAMRHFIAYQPWCPRGLHIRRSLRGNYCPACVDLGLQRMPTSAKFVDATSTNTESIASTDMQGH